MHCGPSRSNLLAFAPEVHRMSPIVTRPRILFIDHTANMGGGEIALLNLVDTINKTTFEPVVALFSAGPLTQRLCDRGIETHVVRLHPSITQTRKDSLGARSLLRIFDQIRALRFVWKLSRWIANQNAALVHTNSLKADIIGGLAARLAGVPVIWHVRDRIDIDYLPGAAVKLFRLLSRLIPNVIIVNSDATLRTLPRSVWRRGLGASALEHSYVVHDGTHLVELPAVPKGSARTQLIGLVGRISPWKGQHVFLKAAAKVLTQFPHCTFQIIGSALFSESDYERDILLLTQELGLKQSVEFLGFQDDVQQLICKLDVLVHASTIGEPFGQVIIEGMACAKPVVATNGGGVPEIVEHQKTGLLVPMNDPASMASAICELLANPQNADALGIAGRERVRSHFTIASTAASVEKIYHLLLGQ